LRIRAIDPYYNELTRRYKCYGYKKILRIKKLNIYDFYNVKYLKFIKNLKEYRIQKSTNGIIKPFYEWFLNEYLPQEEECISNLIFL